MQDNFETLIIASDHAGFKLQEKLLPIVKQNYPDVKVEVITNKLDPDDDYPQIATSLAKRLNNQKKAAGLALCGTGQGICMALNRYRWIRAVVSDRSDIIKLSRLHNDANVLCLPARYIESGQALMLLEIFLSTLFSGQDRHKRRVEQLGSL